MRSGKQCVFITAAITVLLIAAMLWLCACNNSGSENNPGGDDVVVVHVSEDNNIPAVTPDAPAVQTEATATGDVYTEDPNATPGPDDTEEPSSEDPTASPDNSESLPSGTDADPTAAVTPVSGQETPAPTSSGQPDPYVAPLWFDDSAAVDYDMDFDGKNEKVEITLTPRSGYTYTCTVKVTVGASGKELTDTFSTEYFTKALLNNFNSGDGRAELLVCCGSGNRGQITKAYRLNANSNGLNSFGVNGWVETLKGSAIELGRYMDVLGTWACSADFEFSRADFSLVQTSADWTVHRDDENRWCTVSKTLIVELIINNGSENYAGFLSYGDRIYPTATDMSTYIKFVSDLEDIGSITVTTGSNGTLLINGESADNWFKDLEYLR